MRERLRKWLGVTDLERLVGEYRTDVNVAHERIDRLVMRLDRLDRRDYTPEQWRRIVDKALGEGPL